MHLSQKIQHRPLPYAHRLESRGTDCINLAVIHCTELPDLATARICGEKEVYPQSQTGNSGHFYIDRDGSIEEWVPLNRVAHHTRGFNPYSIGIELVNNGRYPDWFQSGHQQMTEPYPGTQIGALAALLRDLAARLPGLESVTGHEDLDTGMRSSQDRPDIMIRRKLDPGPCFPWSVVMDKILLSRLPAKDV
jgi:N-acetylmuramoyl-L-alanine amidase